MAARARASRFAVTCLFGAAALLPGSSGAAPGSWTLNGSLRGRYEALSGQFRPGLNETDRLVSIRTTLFAEFDDGPIRFGAELDDSRAYGGEPGSAVSADDVNALELVQAYAAADLRLGDGDASLLAGRFIMRLGTRRRAGEEDYRNTSPAFTGVRADLRDGRGTSATLFYALPQRRLPDDQPSVLRNAVRRDQESFDLTSWGGAVTRARGWRNITFEAIYFGLREQDGPRRPTRDRRLHTLAARLIREPAAGTIDFAAELARQFGSIRDGLAGDAARRGVSASYFHADLGYSLTGRSGFRLAAEFDQASGDGPGPRHGRFDPLFGVRRPDLAPAGLYGAIGRANIVTPAVRAEIAPNARWDAFVLARALWAEEATDTFSTTGVRDPSGAAGAFAGIGLEGRFRYWLLPARLRAEFNGALLIKRGLLARAPNAPGTGDTAYVAATLTARFS